MKFINVKSNGKFGLLLEPYSKDNHPNQPKGTGYSVDLINHQTGNINTKKLYVSSRGMYFKDGGVHYLKDFTQDWQYIPFQMIKCQPEKQLNGIKLGYMPLIMGAVS